MAPLHAVRADGPGYVEPAVDEEPRSPPPGHVAHRARQGHELRFREIFLPELDRPESRAQAFLENVRQRATTGLRPIRHQIQPEIHRHHKRVVLKRAGWVVR